jgi:hypothetical protein
MVVVVVVVVPEPLLPLFLPFPLPFPLPELPVLPLVLVLAGVMSWPRTQAIRLGTSVDGRAWITFVLVVSVVALTLRAASPFVPINHLLLASKLVRR